MEARRIAGWRFWVGPAITLATIVVIDTAWKLAAPTANVPGSVIAPAILAVVVSTFLAGTASGAVSAAFVTVYAIVSLDDPATPGRFDAMGMVRLFLIVGCAFAGAIVVGYLKGRADEANARALDREREMTRMERIRTAQEKHAADVLRSNNETLETFIYVITHDLKEPVRAVDYHIEKAQQTFASKDGEAQLISAREVNKRLATLLQRLLEYSRASLTTPLVRSLTVRDALDDAACRAIYEHALLISGARLEVQPASSEFLADPTLIAQALGNLILNAIKHNGTGTPILRIIAHEEDDHVVLRLQDNGPGFPQHILQRVAHLRPGRPATVGGGFGLVIARRAIERLEGTMQVGNLAHEGAEITIRLPRASTHPQGQVGTIDDGVSRIPVEAGPEASTIDAERVSLRHS